MILLRIGCGRINMSSVTNWEKVDVAKLAHALGEEEVKLRKVVGLKPYVDFGEAFKVFTGKVIDSKTDATVTADCRLTALRDCIACLESFEQISFLMRVPGLEPEELVSINAEHIEMSRVAVRGAESAAECERLYSLISDSVKTELVVKWKHAAKSVEEMIRFYRMAQMNDVMRRAVLEDLASHFMLQSI